MPFTHSRLTPGLSQAHLGVHPLSSFNHRTQRFQPLPPPLGEPPYHLSINDVFTVAGEQPPGAGTLIFHVVGDTGGILQGEPQANVAARMLADLAGANPPQFFYHLGDVVYFNGQPSMYYAQFYEPYFRYNAPILSIPGNHDGDPIDNTQTSLDGWVEYFMTSTSHVDSLSQFPPRLTVSQPNPYWTLETSVATIVGLYTNVPEGGSVNSVQQQWFTNELATADPNKALIVALHHPVHSFDEHHSGSPRMADVLGQGINDLRRVPNLVLTAHVHDYQRIEQPLVDQSGTQLGITIPYLVAGMGGYHNLHALKDPIGTVDPNNGATLKQGYSDAYGYVTLTVTGGTISGTVTRIEKLTGNPTPRADVFQYPAGQINLPTGATVNL